MVVRTGAYAYVEYDFEGSFNEAICMSTRNKVFGLEQKLTGWTWTNSPIVLNQLNSIEPKTFAFGQAHGTMSIDFVVSNPWYNSFMFAENCMACLFPSGATPFLYTWLATSTDDTKAITQTGAIEVGICECMVADDQVRVASGAIVNSISLRGAIGEPIRGTLDISYAQCTTTTISACPTSETVGRAACQFEPYTFAHGSLTVCNCCVCVTIAELQSFDLSLTQNSELLYGIGCHHAASAYRKIFEMTGSFQAPYIDSTQIDKVYAQIEDNCGTLARCDPTLTLVFDNGVCATIATRTITYSFTGILIRDHNTATEPGEPIFETINWQARSATVTAENGNSVRP